MRILKYILLLTISISALLPQGCVKEEVVGMTNNDKLTTLTVNIKCDNVDSRASNVSTHEDSYMVKTLRIVAIDKFGAVETNVFLDGESEDVILQHTFQVTQDAEKTLYVVVNEPSALTPALNDAKRQMELAQIDYDIATVMNNELFIAGASLGDTNRLIPMSTMTKIDASKSCDVVVYVDRVVARVDLMVDKDEVAYTSNVEFNASTTINVTGLYYNTFLFKPQYPTTPNWDELKSETGIKLSKTTALKLESKDRENAQRLLSFYISERTYNIDPNNSSVNRIEINIDNITVDGQIKNINTSILLGNNVKPYLEEIKRNHIYRIFATYKGEEESLEVNDEYVIKDWVIEEVDGDIEGVMLSVTNQVVMDWTQLGSSLTAKDVAFGSNRSIEISVPTSYDIATNKYEFKKCNIIAQGGSVYNLRDLSQYGVADAENYLLSIPWLTHAEVVFDSEQAGHFNFKYQLGNSPYYMDSVPLQIISANVRKELKIIYDNGYVPSDLLKANDTTGCWEDAPNGIIFAKRGDALHPLLHKDILTSNSDGRYEGDIRTSADQADKYCKDHLGSRWYAPNKAQLSDIHKHVMELGTSYRFNNIADAIYWSSESDNGSNYWAVNFDKQISELITLSAPSTEQHYFRCITNL